MTMQTYSYTSVQSTSTKLHAMPSIKRRAHRRSPSSSESSNDTPQTQVKLLVVDRSTVSTKMNSVTVKYKIPPIRIPAMQIRVPPHKDWYTIKPIPRAPLPLYHPLRVVKPKPAPPMSTALPLTRRIDEKKEVTPEPRPSRQRRPPLRLRELGAAVGTGTGSGPNSPTSELGVETPKPKRQRRTKAETAAAAAAAAAAADGESNAAGSQALRSSKRKRSGSGKDAGGVEEVSGDAVGSGSAGTTTLPERPVKRRRQSKSNEVTSNYGTRSRTIVKRSKRTSSGSDISGSEDANNNEIEEEEDVQIQNHTTVMDEPAMELPRETTAEVATLQPTIEDEMSTGASL